MSSYSAVIFDTDGVMVDPWHPFSVQYAEDNGINPDSLEPFFRGDFVDVTLGKRDLYDALEANRDVWQWDGDVKQLAQMWFEAENNPNQALITLIKELREDGTPCYLATNQEQYRTDFIKQVMFPDIFDAVFASYQLGLRKPDPKFFIKIIEQIGVQSDQAAYFDDQQKNVDGALEAGLDAYLYENPEQIRRVVLEKHEI